MSTIDELDLKTFITKKVVEESLTHEQLSTLLQEMFPNARGFSIRSLQRYCSKEEIHKTSRLNNADLNEAVLTSVMEVGPTYGRKTMTGLLRSKGIVVSEQRVGQALARVSPAYHQARVTATAKQTNPVPYRADYFGQKLHLDQNEKLVMYGVTHTCAVDGHTRKIVGFQTMSIKNNVEIYRSLYCPFVSQYGLWDQLRVDCGKEWYLILAMQQKLSTLRVNQNRPAYLQTTSTMNHPVERIWVEVNARVNYPIKNCLIQMEENNFINITCEVQKFCVSEYSIRVSNVGTTLVVNAWNNHHIPGKGIPNKLMIKNNFTSKVDAALLPTPEQAVREYENAGGRLTAYSQFGIDPLLRYPLLQYQREVEVSSHLNFDTIFHCLVNNNQHPFMHGLLYFIDLNDRLMHQATS